MFGIPESKRKDRPAIICGAPLDLSQNQYTAVIFGMPRSGTTMVAGVALRCGLEIGSNLPLNLEDPDFSNTSMSEMKEAVAERNQRFDVWGWKFPGAGRYLGRLLPHLRNPRFIVVWRDLVATAGRKLAKHDDWFSALAMGHRTQARNLKVLSSANCPILLVSYERATRFPLEFAQTMSEFLMLPPPQDRDELMQFMMPGSYKMGDPAESARGPQKSQTHPPG